MVRKFMMPMQVRTWSIIGLYLSLGMKGPGAMMPHGGDPRRHDPLVECDAGL